MTDGDIPVEPARERDWKQAIRQPKVLIPAAAIIAVGAVVGVLAATAGGADPATSPAGSPSPSISASSSASPAPSASPSGSPTPSASGSATPSASPSPSEPAKAWAPRFVVPKSPSDGTVIATFSVTDAWVIEPIISPDGAKVATGRTGKDGAIFYVGRLDGSQLSKLPEPDAAWNHLPAWSRDGSRVAYITSTDDGPALATALFDGTGVKVIADLPASAGFSKRNKAFLSWSADAKRVAVSLNWRVENPEVLIVDLARGDVTRIADASGAAFAPSGDTLAYYLYGGAQTKLVTQTGKGSVQTLDSFRTSTFGGFFPVLVQWAPDGSRLAYQQDWSDDGWVYWASIRPDGSGEAQLTPDVDTWATHTRWYPAGQWSPDSAHFAALEHLDGELYLASADGSETDTVMIGANDFTWGDSDALATTMQGSVVGAFNIESFELISGADYGSTSLGYSLAPDGTAVVAHANHDAGTAAITVVEP